MFTTNLYSRSGFFITLMAAVLLLAGCASEPPKGALSKAEEAIQNADRVGAAQYEAQLLSSARTKLGRAKQAMNDSENDDARRMAEEAHAEAVLAIAKAEAAKQAKQTDDLQKAIAALKQETSRQSEGQ